MPGVGIAYLPGLQRKNGIHGSYKHTLLGVGHEQIVDPRQDRSWRLVFHRSGPYQCARECHEQGSRHPLVGHVRDYQA